MNRPLNEWAKEIHENSVRHGWWDEPRTVDEIGSLIISELSEALEEYRAGRPLVWAMDGMTVVTDVESIAEYGLKPEGIAVELVDACIRILDYMAVHVAQDDAKRWYVSPCVDIAEAHKTAAELVFTLECLVIHAYDLNPDMMEMGTLRGVIVLVAGWLKAHGMDFEEIMALKHEYNRTRPYRHGGKRL